MLWVRSLINVWILKAWIFYLVLVLWNEGITNPLWKVKIADLLLSFNHFWYIQTYNWKVQYIFINICLFYKKSGYFSVHSVRSSRVQNFPSFYLPRGIYYLFYLPSYFVLDVAIPILLESICVRVRVLTITLKWFFYSSSSAGHNRH